MVAVGLGLGPVFSCPTETKAGPRLFGISQPDRDPDRRSGTPLLCEGKEEGEEERKRNG